MAEWWKGLRTGAAKFFRRAWHRDVSALHGQADERFRIMRVDDLPEAPKKKIVYLAGEKGFEWAAAMLCPCGCNEVISLNLLQEVRPRWILSEVNGLPTLEPSIWRRQGCRSHYFLRRGEVEWCDAIPVTRPARERRKPRTHF